MWPDDPTQWADTDGDGYGDNGTIGATNQISSLTTSLQRMTTTAWLSRPLDFLLRRVQCTWFGARWVSKCVRDLINPLPGCPDSDGDSWANTDDDFHLITQFLDNDGDGFGDSSWKQRR